MKIGILTLHYSCNYGGVLQAYALQKALKDLGYDVDVIDYVPTTYRRHLFEIRLSLRSLKSFKTEFVSLLHSRGLWKSFNAFRSQRMQMSERINEYQLAEINKKYDALIVGSDQVWMFGHDRKSAYFVNWEPLFEGRRISYAPCCTISKPSDNHRDLLSASLKRFDKISVRDVVTQRFVRNSIGESPQIVCDPTILHSFQEFSKPIIAKPYILAYILGAEIKGGHKYAIERLKEKYPNSTVIGIQTCYKNAQLMPWADKVVYTAGPEKWVSLIANATCVYTDSFHGVVFSMKFKRDFVCYYVEDHRSTRFVDLAEKYGIAKNIITHSLELSPQNNFSTPNDVTNAFKEQQKVAVKFLKDALQPLVN